MADRGKYIEVLSKTVKAVKELNVDVPIKISLECVEGILELLKEQDKPTRPVYNGRYWECEKCGEMYQDILEVRKYRHCPWCGRRFEA